jgi:hypothetical protein
MCHLVHYIEFILPTVGTVLLNQAEDGCIEKEKQSNADLSAVR